MGSIGSLKKKSSLYSSGWSSSWVGIPSWGQQDYVSNTSGQQAYVVYKATVDMTGSSRLSSVSVKTNFIYNNGSSSDGSGEVYLYCYLYLRDPTTGDHIYVPGGYSYSSSGSATVPYYGLYKEFSFSVNIKENCDIYFLFEVSNPNSKPVRIWSYNSNNGNTGTPRVTGTFVPLADYTITYDSDGGTTTPSSQTFKEKSSTTVAGAVTKKNTVTDTVFSLTPDANGGKLYSSSETGSCKRTRTTEYSFNFWRSAQGYAYDPGDTYGDNSYEQTSTTMTAQWIEEHTDKYATSISSIHEPTRDTEILPYATVNIYSNHGVNDVTTEETTRPYAYNFSHWKSSSGTEISSSTEFNSDSTIYAHWDESWIESSTPIELPMLFRENYELLGYSRDALASKATYEVGSYVPDEYGIIDLFAVWFPKGTVHLFTEDNVSRKVKVHLNVDGDKFSRVIPYIHDGESYKRCK